MDTVIDSLGDPKIESPLADGLFVADEDRVLYPVSAAEVLSEIARGNEPVSFERAGPRRKIYFDPSKLKVALVTCGGLCPGLNNVIRSVVLTLHHNYGTANILGIRFGLQGFVPKYGHPILELTPGKVAGIHNVGGTVLSSSRGPQDLDEIVDSLERLNIGLLIMIGGDGTFRAAAKVSETVKDRGLRIGIIGIPKTIDNDITLISKSFGFGTAVSVATRAISSAHVESLGAPNGVGLVKLMGRHSGFIAAAAALAKKEANLVLIPEVDFEVEGPNGLLAWLEKRLEARRHAVIVVAEGAGQRYCSAEGADKSGNVRLGDIGQWLKERIARHFEGKGLELNLKYIDPSYMIRSVPADAEDSVFCGFLAQNAVHAGLAGKTNMVVGQWNNQFVHIPINLVVHGRKHVDPNGSLWRSVLEATGQPSFTA
jgi:6-phosphofructokinase 1